MSHRERIFAIVTSLVIAALVLDWLLLTPLMERLKVANTRIADARSTQTLANETLQNELRARRRWREMAGDSLETAAPSAEGAVLNGVRDWAQRSGLTLSSLKPERSETQQGYGKLTIRATGTGGMQAVARFLYAMEMAEIPLRVVDVTVTSRREGTDDLNVQVGLATIYLPPEEPGATAGDTAVRSRSEVGR